MSPNTLSTPSLRARRALVAVAAGGLLLGGTGVAYAVTSTTPPSTTPSSGPPSSGAPSSGTATAPPVRQPDIGGTVTSVSGNTVLVTDRDGFTRTILTSSTTTYGTGLSDPLAVGTVIHAVGTVDADKTSLDATAITVARAKAAGKPGRHKEGAEAPGAPEATPDATPAPSTSPAPNSSAPASPVPTT